MACLWVESAISWYLSLDDFLPDPFIRKKILRSAITALLAVMNAVFSWIRYKRDKKKNDENQESVQP